MKVLGVLLLALPSITYADISQCDRYTGHNGGEGDHIDLGGGGIAYTRSSFGMHDGLGGSSENLLVVSCHDGDTIVVGLSAAYFDAQFSDEWSVAVDAKEEVMTRFSEMVASNSRYSFSDVLQEMRTLSPDVELESRTRFQPCGCAVLYPSLGTFERSFDLTSLQ